MNFYIKLDEDQYKRILQIFTYLILKILFIKKKF